MKKRDSFYMFFEFDGESSAKRERDESETARTSNLGLGDSIMARDRPSCVRD